MKEILSKKKKVLVERKNSEWRVIKLLKLFQKRLNNGKKKTKKSSEIPDSEIPETLDWRDFMGYDFTSSFRD